MAKRKNRRSFKGKEKAEILKKVLVEGKPVSDVCDEHKIQPGLFYQWQKQLFENMEMAFVKDRDIVERQLRRENQALQRKLAQKNDVIAEVTEAYVREKKSHGES